jgi:hypothetical protein
VRLGFYRATILGCLLLVKSRYDVFLERKTIRLTNTIANLKFRYLDFTEKVNIRL